MLRKIGRLALRLLDALVCTLGKLAASLSGEWIFRKHRHPNGGGIVLGRAAWATIWLYAIAIGLAEALKPGNSWSFSPEALRLRIADTLPWFGAIFAGMYVTLHTKFGSQWTYLAGLYNQIMAAQVENPIPRFAVAEEPNERERRRLMALWKAGFIEDAEDLHLATKPMFAAVIRSMLQLPEVCAEFEEHTKDGAERRKLLEEAVYRVMGMSDSEARAHVATVDLNRRAHDAAVAAPDDS